MRSDHQTTPAALWRAARRTVLSVFLKLGYDPEDEDCFEGPRP